MPLFSATTFDKALHNSVVGALLQALHPQGKFNIHALTKLEKLLHASYAN